MEKDVVFGDVPMRVAYTEENREIHVESVHVLGGNRAPCGPDLAPMFNVCLMCVPGFPPVPLLQVLFMEMDKCSNTMN